MLIGPADSSDIARVRELSRLSGSGFDPEEELARPWARILVARGSPAGEAMGFALFWRAADEVHVIDLAVAPEARRGGVGRALLDTVIGEARAGDARLLLLEVRAGNAPALALYRSAGFFEHGVRRAYYSDNGEDAVDMRLSLTPEPSNPGLEP
jgi:[ribosomal protein S18]-alanine N-acetyltransferase